MGNVAVVGAQWGDEGKGKIVDWLSERADVVVRFQGGHNAGHTLVIDGRTYKLSLLPSGVVRPGRLSIIGNGVVIDPWALMQEIETLRGMGVTISVETLRIAENAALILPLHGELDRARELAREGSKEGMGKIGTTGRGIGPAYEDKAARRAIRVCDLADPAMLETRLHELLLHHNALRRGFGIEEIDGQRLLKDLQALAPQAPPLRRAGLAAPGRAEARRPPHPVRGCARHHARRRPRHLPLRHLLQHGGRVLPPPAPASAPTASATCWASARPTPPASAPAPSPPSSRTTPAGAWASAAASSAPSPAAPAAAAGSTPSSSARRSSSAASRAWR